MFPSGQGSGSSFKWFEDPWLAFTSLEMELWYLYAQPCWRGNEQSQSPRSAKASGLECGKKSQDLSQLFPLSLSACVSSSQDVWAFCYGLRIL